MHVPEDCFSRPVVGGHVFAKLQNREPGFAVHTPTFAMNVSQIYDNDDSPVEMKIDIDKEAAN